MRINALFRNEVTLRALDAQGNCLAIQRARNTLTHAAADVLINALIRSGPSVVTHLYARFGDSGANPGDLNPESGHMVDVVRGDFVASSDGIRGGLWVKALTAPMQESTDSAIFSGNKATFLFRIPANIPADQISPADNYVAGTSYIYALGLGVATVGGDRTQDLIISVLNDFNPFPIPPTGQYAVDYPMELTI